MTTPLFDECDELDAIISSIAVLSNPDWTEKRNAPHVALDEIHALTSAVIGGVIKRTEVRMAARTPDGCGARTMSELLPCPFCGNDGTGPVEDALHVSHTQNDWHRFYDCYSVQCDKCTATMGFSESEEAAIEAWNTRLHATMSGECEDCDEGRIWNNADPASGQWVECENCCVAKTLSRDAELVAEVVAQRCSTGADKNGSPKAPHRYAIIWQAARLGAIEYARMTKGDVA